MSKIIKGNTVGTTMPRADYAQTDPTKADFIKNKPDEAIQKAQRTADNAKTTADNALPKSGGTITGIVILTEGVHYGDSLPDAGTAGRIFFLRIQ